MQNTTSSSAALTPHITLAHLHAGYGATPVLNDIHLEIAQGEFVALLGASGCGKTTLLRTIAGFSSPDAGAVLVNGQDITHFPPEKRGMALVFQSYALWPHMTVAQHIAYGLKLRRLPRAEIARRVTQLESMLGLTGLGERKPAQLSGGQRQRVALGRALAIQPDILLLDEPLSNLDTRIRLQLRDEIRALQQRLGLTAIHVTHDREEAMVMADRIVILHQGRVMQAGSPQQVYHHPTSAFVAAFMGAENQLMLEAYYDGDRLTLRGDEQGAALVPRHSTLQPGMVEARFRAEAAQLYDATQAPPAAPGMLVRQGTVLAQSYPGGHWQHTVVSGVWRMQVHASAPYAVGQRVEVQIPAEALFLFSASDASAPFTATSLASASPSHDSLPGLTTQSCTGDH
ncbi:MULTISPECIES: ABC transporter ATP-binding protein [unclassified Symbiopectobacterium]|uniref:ABC transporter ATP-binding protein n=1 Tax=unclassified Symbiopectobacterium TaxID=2794573 RepID=UPI00222661D6|nr:MULTISPECIES: ABC transporter ATP-binding protein [unclassified Symbiopectobacterium]MCW2476341.1 ABC transporter ATP-binding protein [Candidatus Symbiopectobacterium sp. NZEC151]MCW2487707.1 ABC transporter ATP-binding protein [Candidatus Symbiopectobacterium sp. NZEC127]